MPVKFRCQHCKQLLGISRRKVGQVVDCPKCGRSVRVPAEDGLSKAAPAPELNLDDPALAKALDELAAIGKHGQSALAGPIPGTEPLKTRQDPDEDWLEPELLPAEPPLPAEKLQAPIKELPAKGSPRPVDPPRAVTAEPPPAVSDRDPSEAVSLSAAMRNLATLAGPSRAALPPRASHARTVIAIAAAGLAGLALGIAVGPLLRPAPPNSAPAEAPPVAARPEPDPAPVPAFRGRLTYRKPPNTNRGDEGGVILFLPINEKVRIKMAPTGLRPGDADSARQAASDVVKAIGGGLAVAGKDGEYTVMLPGPGTFNVIALSAHQSRDKEHPLPPRLSAALASFVDSPAELLGDLAVSFGQVSYNGTKTEPWDYAFEAP